MALYDEAVAIAKTYIGPVGQQFLDRQLTTHLNLKPAELSSANIPDLSKWCLASGRLVIDVKQATEFSEKIKMLAK